MELGISTQVFGHEQLSVQLLGRLRSHGYRYIELFANRPHLDFHNRDLQKAVAHWFASNDLPPPSLHLPFFERIDPAVKEWLSVVDREKRQRERAMDEIKRALEIADRLTLRHVVLHLGAPGDTFSPPAFDHAYAAIEKIQAFAGVRVLVENILNELSTIDRIHELFDVARLGNVGVCYDTGHGQLEGGAMPRFDRVGAIHLNDNKSNNDDHLWPFEGNLKWAELIEAMARSGYEGCWLFEPVAAAPEQGVVARQRLENLWVEAAESIVEFRQRHELLPEG